MMKIFSREGFRNDENICYLDPLNGEEFWIVKNIFNLVPLNSEGFRNDENICNLDPLNREEFWIDKNIFNLVPLNLLDTYQSHTDKQRRILKCLKNLRSWFAKRSWNLQPWSTKRRRILSCYKYSQSCPANWRIIFK